MSTLKEIGKDLKEKGAKKEDIKMALAIMVYLSSLDSLVFPENPAIINFSIRRHRFGYPVGHHPAKNDEARYNIYLDGVARFLREEKKERGLWIPNLNKGSRNRSKLLRPTWEELLVPMAAHEVRHRVQCDCSCGQFSPKNTSLVKDRLLRAIVTFEGYVFEENKKTWTQENKPRAYIQERMEPKEFDASVIERLIAAKIHGKNAYSLREEIVSIIKMSAPKRPK